MSDDETGNASSQLEPYSDDSDGDRRTGQRNFCFVKKLRILKPHERKPKKSMCSFSKTLNL